MQNKKPRARRPDARARLLAGAARVFARDGLAGATTRAIAREAKVNEVTLFRLFRSKERLLAAVVGTTFGAKNPLTAADLPPLTGNLRADLILFGRHYERRLTENLPLVRTFVGEIQHHRGCERQVLKGIFRPLRAALVQRFEQALLAGELRPGADAAIIADLFLAMLFTGVLRRSSAVVKLPYSAAQYTAAAVDLFLRGTAA